ncbi:hypothetical protein B0H14DRAFT_2635502 [Mycena olivaceomarginata]|nr:hypothetical protein B0H14DRAFT_2635502 [Mycena olivaceomarginata]
MAFASDLFSLLENSEYEECSTIPALHTISICLVPIKYNPIDQDQLMRAVEAQWQGGSWRSFHICAMELAPLAATLGQMEGFREKGMEIELVQDSQVLYEIWSPLILASMMILARC